MICFCLMLAGCGAAPADYRPDTPTVSLSPSGAPGEDASVSPLPSGPAQVPLPSPTPSPSQGCSAEEAEQLIRDEIMPGHYDISLLSDTFEFNGELWYTFVITKNGTTMEPLVLVGQSSGELRCISERGIVRDFTLHPLYRLPAAPTPEPPSPSPTSAPQNPDEEIVSKWITPEEALRIFRELTSEQTGLSGTADGYLFYINEELNRVMDTECYTILAYTALDGRLFFEALFYITADGSSIYRKTDATGELEIFSLH